MVVLAVLLFVELALAVVALVYGLRLRKRLAQAKLDMKPFRHLIDLKAEEIRIGIELEEEASRIAKLKEDYRNGKKIYDRILEENLALQEDMEDLSFGLYHPHFSYETSEDYKDEMEGVYSRKKELIRTDDAADFSSAWTVNGNRRDGARMIKNQVKVMLRAFNGECDAAVAKVTWNNVTKMEERIRKAFAAINALGVVHQVKITDKYLQLCLDELRLTHEYEQKKQDEKEEQRQIREQMREEERVQKEYERAQREAALERDKAEKALAQARAELQKATGDHLEAIQEKVRELEQKVVEAQAKQDRAVSMAQITKMGHVYVISNIGSFGEGVFKIGLTRRLEPEDRIRELGGASVPFGFDTHAMVFSEDAPALESAFHREFSSRRLNLVNTRKEYFRVSLDEIEAFSRTQGVKINFTKLAEARHYRESEALRIKAHQAGLAPLPKEEVFPSELFAED
jgi:hypothetical protein